MNSVLHQHRLLLVAFALLCVGIGLYGYLYMRITALHESIGTLQGERAELLANLAAARNADTQLTRIRERYQEFLTHVVSRENPSQFITRLEEVGTAIPVELTVSNLRDEVVDGEDVRELTATVVVAGAWEHVLQALSALETLPYVGSIDRVAFERGVSEQASEWSATVNLRMLLR